MTTRRKYIVDIANSPDKNLMYEFARKSFLMKKLEAVKVLGMSHL